MKLDLDGKCALITGGTRGVGKAIAVKLAEQGVHLALNYFRNRKAAEETAQEIAAISGHKPLLLKANVGDPEKVKDMFLTLKETFSQIDFVISNAASGVLKPAQELSKRHLEWTMEINAYALMYLSQSAVPMMPEGGRIIAVSSLGSVRAIPNYTAVGASKAALESMVRHLSVELAPKINVNTLSAGVIDTEALTHFPNREALLAESERKTPAGRLTLPEDVADVALFLCSKLADMIYGQTITVDGGYSILS